MHWSSATQLRARAVVRGLGWIISLTAITILVSLAIQTDWPSAAQLFQDLRLEWLITAVLFAFSVELLKGFRWQALLGVSSAAVPRLLWVMFTGRLLNTLAPLRAGDIWRLSAASIDGHRPFIATTGSILLEKTLD